MGNLESTLDVKSYFSPSLEKVKDDCVRVVRVDLLGKPALGSNKSSHFEVYVIFDSSSDGGGIVIAPPLPDGLGINYSVMFPSTTLHDFEVYNPNSEKPHVIQRDQAIGIIVDEPTHQFIKLSYDPESATGVDWRVTRWHGSDANFSMLSRDLVLGYPVYIFRQDNETKMLVEPKKADNGGGGAASKRNFNPKKSKQKKRVVKKRVVKKF